MSSGAGNGGDLAATERSWPVCAPDRRDQRNSRRARTRRARIRVLPRAHPARGSDGSWTAGQAGPGHADPLSALGRPGARTLVPGVRRLALAWFRGISFAAPARWALVRNGHWGCPFPTVPATVILIPAANTERPRCPVMFGVAGPMTAHVEVIAGAGPSGGPGQPGYDGCRLLHGLRACYSASAYNGGLLNVAVFVPGRQRATLIEIGLGNGAVARTIFDSIRPR